MDGASPLPPTGHPKNVTASVSRGPRRAREQWPRAQVSSSPGPAGPHPFWVPPFLIGHHHPCFSRFCAASTHTRPRPLAHQSPSGEARSPHASPASGRAHRRSGPSGAAAAGGTTGTSAGTKSAWHTGGRRSGGVRRG